jgi:hypothetical protein
MFIYYTMMASWLEKASDVAIENFKEELKAKATVH